MMAHGARTIGRRTAALAATLAAAAVAVAAPAIARADDDRDADADAGARAHHRDDDGVVIVNGAGPDLAGPDVLAKLRKRLDALGALNPTPPAVAAALEGTSPVDLGPIQAAYEDLDYDHADQLIDVAMGDLLATGDPDELAAPVAELLHWRGLVAAGLGARDDAVVDFAASRRLAPERPVDRSALPPRVRELVDRAERPVRRTGTIALELTDDHVELAVDGGRARPAPPDLELEAGLHLLVVTADDGAHDAALVLVEPGRTTVHRAELARESDATYARRVRDDAVAARSDHARLARARPLADLTGARKLLVIEGDDPDHLRVRVYDLQARKVSEALDLREATRPSVLAALIGVDDAALGRERARPWRRRWYVWAAAGVVVAGAATGAYLYSQRDPSHITGF
ncbi:MAG TPA: hypothetical protein VHE35_24725 [Kofleriaceae bacterium]|nr:hypothetical protein [Kofleriaceae bacterium]